MCCSSMSEWWYEAYWCVNYGPNLIRLIAKGYVQTVSEGHISNYYLMWEETETSENMTFVCGAFSAYSSQIHRIWQFILRPLCGCKKMQFLQKFFNQIIHYIFILFQKLAPDWPQFCLQTSLTIRWLEEMTCHMLTTALFTMGPSEKL